MERNPGIKFREIMRATGLKNGVVSHYLGRLVRDGSVRAVRTTRQARYYPPGVSAPESAVIKALRRETPRRILHCLMVAGPRAGLEFSHISERVGKAPSTVSVCLSQLVSDGVVEAGIGRAKAYAVADRDMVDGLIERYHPGLLDGPTTGLQEIINAL